MKKKTCKIILFDSKNSKKLKYKFPNNTSKVLPFPKYNILKKLNVIKKKSKKKNRSKFYLSNYIKFFIIIVLGLFFLKYILPTNTVNINNSVVDKSFINKSNNLYSDGYNNYSSLILSYINIYLDNNYSDFYTLTNIHKNGDYMYGYGFLTMSKNEKIYFDIILKNDKVNSLIINNIEYIK